MSRWKKAKRYSRRGNSFTKAATSSSVPEGSGADARKSGILLPYLIIEALQSVTWTNEDEGYSSTCRPGDMLFLPEATARMLLDETGNKVRFIAAFMKDAASEIDDDHVVEMYWEGTAGKICGLAAFDWNFISYGPQGRWFLLTNCNDGQMTWVHGSAMRTRQQYEVQRALRELEPEEPKSTEMPR